MEEFFEFLLINPHKVAPMCVYPLPFATTTEVFLCFLFDNFFRFPFHHHFRWGDWLMLEAERKTLFRLIIIIIFMFAAGREKCYWCQT